MAICKRCGKEFEEHGVPRFVVCETEASALYCSGYASYEVDLCPDCTVELEKFMNERTRGTTNGVVE
jgi:hypothetical protein